MTDTESADAQKVAPRPGVTKKRLAAFGAHRAQALLTKQKALATLSRQECFDKGFLTVQELDDEELRYGRCRDANGVIPKSNGKTELIPKELYDEMVAEHEARFKQKLRQNTDHAIEVIVGIMNDDTVEPKDRLDAAKYIFERTAGKTPERVMVNVRHAPWEELLNSVTGIAALTRDQHRELGSGIVEAEFEDITDERQPDDDQEVQADEETPPNQEEGTPHESAEGSATTTPDGYSAGESRQWQDVEPGDTQIPGPYSEPAEPYTQKGGPTAQALDYHIEQVRAERLSGTIEVDNERPVYNTEGDIQGTHLGYGRRADENRTYAQQTQDAARLAERRKEARDKIKQAKKQRKVARAMGVDAIKDEITGISVADDGQVSFE